MADLSLSEGSKSYYSEADVYEIFAKAEDAPGFVEAYLTPLIDCKEVLDLGCGTGKYAQLLAGHSNKYFGIDASEKQLEIAKRKIDNEKVQLIQAQAQELPFANDFFDIVISTWVLGTILDEERRLKAVEEAERVLKKNGRIILIENDVGGEFEWIRGRYPNIERTKTYNDWLESKGFKVVKRFETFFDFPSHSIAVHAFKSIWGVSTAAKVYSKEILHNVIVFEKAKSCL